MLRFQGYDVDTCFLGDTVSSLRAASVIISIARVAPPTSVSWGTSSCVPDALVAFCVKAGDFRKDGLPEADLYIVCGLLRGWPDDTAHELLSRIAGTCRPGEAASPRLLPQTGRRIFLNTHVNVAE